MNQRDRRTARLSLLLLASLFWAGCRPAEVYPSRPIVLICPWSAGGGTDRVARQVAALLEADLGVPVNVVNATGGAGVTGHTRGALARPDGYTLTIITVELNMLHWRGLTNIDYEDFEPLYMLNRDDAALFVRADSPWNSLADLERALRARQRGLKASGTAQGGIWHVALAGWLDHLGLATDDVTWISINGAAPSLQELLSGGVAMVCCSLPEAQTLLDAGEIRCLGVMAEERVPAYPDVPTLREQGSNWSIGGWRGLALPRNVPRDRVEPLVAAIGRVVASDAYRRFMDSNGFNTSIEGPQEFARSLAAYEAQFREILSGDAFHSVRVASYGPYIFPAALAVAIVVALIAMFLTGGLRRPDDHEPIAPGGFFRIAVAVGWVIAFLVLMEVLGYVLTGTVLLFALLLFLRVRWLIAAVVSLVLVPLSYQVFAVVLRVPLPWGWLGW